MRNADVGLLIEGSDAFINPHSEIRIPHSRRKHQAGALDGAPA
jgi:hypothetical protein